MFSCKIKEFKPGITEVYKKDGDIYRFRKAYKEGIVDGQKLRKVRGGKEYKMDRSGVNFETVLKELQDNTIKQKKSHYIWYIFPQPIYKSGTTISKTSRFFYINDDEIKMMVQDKKLGGYLREALLALIKKNLTPQELTYYFSPSGDHHKFKSFRKQFLKVIKTMKQKNSTVQDIYDFLERLDIV